MVKSKKSRIPVLVLTALMPALAIGQDDLSRENSTIHNLESS